MLFELASGLAERGHDVHFVHGPANPDRIESLDELPDFPFDDGVRHHIVDSIDDPSLPDGDVIFNAQAPRRLGLPVVLIQGYRMLGAEAEHNAFRVPAPKICVARWLVDVGRDLGVPADQLLYIPLGLDQDRFSCSVDPAERSVDVATLHHRHPEKGWDVGRRMLSELLVRRPGLRAIVFGVNPPIDGVPEGVELLVAPDAETLVDQVFNQTRVYVQASRREGFGYTPVEAMACGAALVTTDNGGSRDYAVDGETAVVVPPGDPSALADAVEGLLDDQPRRVRLARTGERHVRQFNWRESAARLETHLENYLADPGRFQQPPTDPALVDDDAVRAAAGTTR